MTPVPKRAKEPAKVWIVGIEPLDDGPEGGPYPVAAYSSQTRAQEHADAIAAPKMGTRHWWGTVTKPETCYTIWAFEVDPQ